MGTQSYVLDNGVVQATPSLTLTDLLSISQFTKHNNCKIILFPSHCAFQDLSTGRRICSVHERRGMYYLDDRVTPTVLVADQPDQVLLWHWSLGHLSLQQLQFVVPITSFVSSLGCESCELGKHHRATYQSRDNNHSSSVFELVHSDIWVLIVYLPLKVLNIFSFLLMTSLA